MTGRAPGGGDHALFDTLAYGLGWGWVLSLAASGMTVVVGRGWPTHVPALLGPAVAAVTFALLDGRGAVRGLPAVWGVFGVAAGRAGRASDLADAADS